MRTTSFFTPLSHIEREESKKERELLKERESLKKKKKKKTSEQGEKVYLPEEIVKEPREGGELGVSKIADPFPSFDPIVFSPSFK